MSKLDYTLNKRVEDLTGMEIWGLFFGHVQDPRYREIINNIIKTKEEVGMATELLLEVSQDERERARMMSRKKFLMDETSNRITAQRLMAKGAAEERRKNVEHMYSEGFSVAQIAKGLGLSEKDVNDILGL
jgi:DNA-binding NarL/FixJ family response regulator